MTLVRNFLFSMIFAATLPAAAPAAPVELLNVSYDPTRELYQEINSSFAKSWAARTRQQVQIKQSHGGSGKQARAAIDGLPGDVVTPPLGYDRHQIAPRGLVP